VKERECLFVGERERVRVSACLCVRMNVSSCVCVCVFVRERARARARAWKKVMNFAFEIRRESNPRGANLQIS